MSNVTFHNQRTPADAALDHFKSTATAAAMSLRDRYLAYLGRMVSGDRLTADEHNDLAIVMRDVVLNGETGVTPEKLREHFNALTDLRAKRARLADIVNEANQLPTVRDCQRIIDEADRTLPAKIDAILAPKADAERQMLERKDIDEEARLARRMVTDIEQWYPFLTHAK